MRRWTLTLFLLGAAAAAAVVAPRLTRPAPVVVVEPVTIPEVMAPPVIVEVPSPPVATIPELSEPVRPSPPPPPPGFWDNCAGCGMG